MTCENTLRANCCKIRTADRTVRMASLAGQADQNAPPGQRGALWAASCGLGDDSAQYGCRHSFLAAAGCGHLGRIFTGAVCLGNTAHWRHC
jgi:hypothetical protein